MPITVYGAGLGLARCWLNRGVEDVQQVDRADDAAGGIPVYEA